VIIQLNDSTRIIGTERAWVLQKTRIRNNRQTWSSFRWFSSFSSALQDAAHHEIRTHPAQSLSEAIEAVAVIVRRYEQLIPSEYQISK